MKVPNSYDRLKARERARQRALTRLSRRYKDEYYDIYDEELAAENVVSIVGLRRREKPNSPHPC